MSFVLGPPSSSGATNFTSISSLPAGFFMELSNALPIGKEALRLLGGHSREATAAKGNGSNFPDEKIVIPLGVTPQNLSKYTLYDILGFGGELGASADIEAIRRAYHKAVLLYHPDKAQFKTADGKEDRTVFLKIQEAFAVLCSEPKRRAYDSQLPFNESIPSEERVAKALAKGPAKFFKLFTPIFQRNARFAAQKPVPELGDENTPIASVYKFYDYWVKFESWRDFTGVGAEHKPEDASSREEKRWMQKENERIAKKLKKKEMERLIALVAIAEKNDPRINADKERRRLAKEAQANAKEATVRQKAEEEAAALAWAEAAETVERERQAAGKADKEKAKKAAAKARNLLRKLLRASAELNLGNLGEYGLFSTADVELLLSHGRTEELVELCNGLGGDAAAKDVTLVAVASFEQVTIKIEEARTAHSQAAEDEIIAREAKKREAEERNISSRKTTNAAAAAAAGQVPAERIWTRDELSALARSVSRYPAGTANRWAIITNYMNVTLKPPIGESYREQELLRAAYKLAHAPHEMLVAEGK